MSIATLRTLVVLEDGLDLASIRAALPAGGNVRVATLREAAERGTALLDEAPADLVVVGCAEPSDSALRLIAAAAAHQPDRPIVVLYPGSPNGFMEAAFDAGADDLIALPQTPAHIAFALEKVVARRRGAATPVALGPMICVLGPKGGTGKTLTSCNLAVALALAGKRVALVDLDLQFGDVGLALGLRPERTIYDLVVSGGSLDADKVDSFMMRHESGASVLLAPVRPDQAGAIEISFLRNVYEILRARYDFVIVDTPPAFSPEVIGSIDASSDLCMVGMLDALSLKDTRIGCETLDRMGYDPTHATLVLNRADSNVGITTADVEQLLGRRPDVLVPSDRAIPRAITHGRPIVLADPKSGPARAFTSLAERYIRDRAAAPKAAGDSVKSEQGGRGLRVPLLGKAS
jgi:pilus assembly protein CpaE